MKETNASVACADCRKHLVTQEEQIKIGRFTYCSDCSSKKEK